VKYTEWFFWNFEILQSILLYTVHVIFVSNKIRSGNMFSTYNFFWWIAEKLEIFPDLYNPFEYTFIPINSTVHMIPVRSFTNGLPTKIIFALFLIFNLNYWVCTLLYVLRCYTCFRNDDNSENNYISYRECPKILESTTKVYCILWQCRSYYYSYNNYV